MAAPKTSLVIPCEIVLMVLEHVITEDTVLYKGYGSNSLDDGDEESEESIPRPEIRDVCNLRLLSRNFDWAASDLLSKMSILDLRLGSTYVEQVLYNTQAGGAWSRYSKIRIHIRPTMSFNDFVCGIGADIRYLVGKLETLWTFLREKPFVRRNSRGWVEVEVVCERLDGKPARASPTYSASNRRPRAGKSWLTEEDEEELCGYDTLYDSKIWGPGSRKRVESILGVGEWKNTMRFGRQLEELHPPH